MLRPQPRLEHVPEARRVRLEAAVGDPVRIDERRAHARMPEVRIGVAAAAEEAERADPSEEEVAAVIARVGLVARPELEAVEFRREIDEPGRRVGAAVGAHRDAAVGAHRDEAHVEGLVHEIGVVAADRARAPVQRRRHRHAVADARRPAELEPAEPALVEQVQPVERERRLRPDAGQVQVGAVELHHAAAVEIGRVHVRVEAEMDAAPAGARVVDGHDVDAAVAAPDEARIVPIGKGDRRQRREGELRMHARKLWREEPGIFQVHLRGGRRGASKQ